MKITHIRLLLLLICCCQVVVLSAQQRKKKISFRKANTHSYFEDIPKGKALVYGDFLQSVKLAGWGATQTIRIINTDTEKGVFFSVKPHFSIKKENAFCIALDPGLYAIYRYEWTKGYTTYSEPILKGIDARDNFNKKRKSGEIQDEDLEFFLFKVEANTLNYLGTWNFESGIVSFIDEKEETDAALQKKYKKLNFQNSMVNLPE